MADCSFYEEAGWGGLSDFFDVELIGDRFCKLLMFEIALIAFLLAYDYEICTTAFFAGGELEVDEWQCWNARLALFIGRVFRSLAHINGGFRLF